MIEPIIIPSRKLGNIIYALGALIFVILGLILLLTADILPILVGLFAIAFFGWGFIIFVKRIFNNQPLLMVN